MPTGVTVLVVDDNADHQLLMTHALRDTSFEVRTASSAEEALNDLDGVDLVLLDQTLPGMSGVEALRRINAAGTASVVMVTGMGSEDLVVEAMQAGALDYLIKRPGYLQHLPEVVRRAWQQHDLRKRSEALQRLALLVTSETDRDRMFAEIVRGARLLIAADGCALAVIDERGVALAASDGVLPVEPHTLERTAIEALISPSPAPLPGPDEAVSRLVVPLPSVDGEQLGVLMMLTTEPRRYPRAELELAEAFAAYAGTGLQNLRRFELERRLITELQQAADARRDFIGAVSHELRTPLTCILGFSETLRDQWTQLDGDVRLDFVDRIRQNAQALDELIERLLDAAAAERGEFRGSRAEALSLAATVREALDRLAPLLAGRRLSIDADDAVVVEANEALIRRALANLVSNAIKYSPPDSEVTVRVRTDERAGVVEVVDRGVGLEPDERRRVFEPFWRSSANVTTYDRGTGLGLTLVRQYVESMGGRVGVVSEPGEGSTFWFSVPLASGEREPAGS